MFSRVLDAVRSVFGRHRQGLAAQTTLKDPTITPSTPEPSNVDIQAMVTALRHGTSSALGVTETVMKANGVEPPHPERPGKRRKMDTHEVTTVPTTTTTTVSVVIDNTNAPLPATEKALPVRSKDDEADKGPGEGNSIIDAKSCEPESATDGDRLSSSDGMDKSPSDLKGEHKKWQDTPGASIATLEDASTTLSETPGTALDEAPLPEESTARDDLGDAATKQMTGKASPQPVKAQHVRFGSEEPAVAAQSEVNVPLQPTLEVQDTEHESEDEAPETVTLASGLEKARESALDAIKAAGWQETAAKKKRQARDAQLKAQARSSRKTKKRKLDESIERDDHENKDLLQPETPNHPPRSSASRFTLPALLPDSILATEPAVRPPTPPPEPENRIIKSKRHQFFESKDKPPKDIRRGPVNVRVLESNKSLLPPRSSKTSAALRESWLSGRRGKMGMNGFERQKIGGGFLRR
ncbi:MAG: hypothetical protein M1835_002913 [Candelina submexicana]|nr:MAG: hypothetical protein M1835_002913 [Candelina submexicana]